jgi:AcrR family transcriptional regulator
MTQTETVSAGRPMRADARRNYDRLVTAGREAFRENEGNTTLEQIAKRAGVGIGTLYRHFPTRLALMEAVYSDEVDDLGAAAERLTEEAEPWNALVAWLRLFLLYAATKRSLFHEISDEIGKDAALLTHSREVVQNSARAVLSRAQEAGVARADVESGDVTRLVGGCTMMPGGTDEQQERILQLVLAGIRA